MKCLNCDNEIPEKRKFCSLSCSVTYNNKKREKKIRIGKCLNCEKEIKGGKKFCNHSCSAVYNNKNKVYKHCLNCNKKLKLNIKKFCNHKCQFDYQRNIYIENWKNGIIVEKRITYIIRNYIFQKFNNKCSNHDCNWNGILINPYSKKSILHIEHIDGNPENNKEENLKLLCPNCHSLTPTFGFLNKGNGRKERRERYKKGMTYREILL